VGPLRNAVTGPARALAVLLLLLLAGCTKDPDPVPAACVGEPSALLAALEHAPRAVVLEDGTPLSRCVSAARTDGDLQSLGIAFGRVADALRAQAASDPDAALRLGYLAGAVHTGAATGHSGIALQLARRVEQLAMLAQDAGASSTAALRRGLHAGASSG
jgi:type IV pilus biogenesis protein CpaD/CtpE